MTTQILAQESSATVLAEYYYKYHTKLDALDTIPSEKIFTFIKYDLNRLKEALQKLYKHNINMLSMEIPNIFQRTIDEMNAKSNGITEVFSIDHPPMGFMNLEEIACALKLLKVDVENSYQIYRLMRMYGVEVTETSKDDFMGKLRRFGHAQWISFNSLLHRLRRLHPEMRRGFYHSFEIDFLKKYSSIWFSVTQNSFNYLIKNRERKSVKCNSWHSVETGEASHCFTTSHECRRMHEYGAGCSNIPSA